MRILKYIFVILAVILQSCGGSDDSPAPPAPIELGAFNLTFPDNNEVCTEGVDISNDMVEIPFRWTTSENAVSYKIEVTNTETGQKHETTSSTNSGEVVLPKGTQFTWKVIAVAGDKTKDSNADWNFYSQGLSTSNHIPFPASITLEDNKDGTINVSWQGSDLDNDIANYQVYFGESESAASLISETLETRISNQGIQYGTTYFLNIITIDQNGNTSSSKKEFKFSGNNTPLYIFHDSAKKLAVINIEDGSLSYIGENIEYGINSRGAVYSSATNEYIGFEDDFGSNRLVKINLNNGASTDVPIPAAFLTNGTDFKDPIMDNGNNLYIFHGAEKKLAKVDQNTGNLTYIGNNIDYGVNVRGAVYHSGNNEYIGFENDYTNIRLVRINLDTGNVINVPIPNSYLTNGSDFDDLVINSANDEVFISHTSEKKVAKINIETGDLTYFGNNIIYGSNTRGAIYHPENNEYIGFEVQNGTSYIVRTNLSNESSRIVSIPSSFLTNGNDFSDLTSK